MILCVPARLVAIELSDSAMRMAFDPLRYAHIVVRGRITTVTAESVPATKCGYKESGNKTVDVITLMGARTLRGTDSPGNIVAWSDLVVGDLVGREAVLCAKWIPPLGSYLVGYGGACLVETQDGTWARYDGSETITTEELDARLLSTRPEAVARSAGIAVIGKVVSVADSVLDVDGHMMSIRRVGLRIEQLIKGQYDGSIIDFVVVLAGGGYAPPWRTATPTEFDIGEEWIAFLARGPGFYYPSAGMNGLLRVQGDTLLYDRVAPYRYSRGRFLGMVEETLGD
jgi:hypothetical protein